MTCVRNPLKKKPPFQEPDHRLLVFCSGIPQPRTAPQSVRPHRLPPLGEGGRADGAAGEPPFAAGLPRKHPAVRRPPLAPSPKMEYNEGESHLPRILP